jgi:hypothetical protein
MGFRLDCRSALGRSPWSGLCGRIARATGSAWAGRSHPVAAGPAWRRPVTIGPVAHTYTVPAAVLGNSNGLATVPGLEVWRSAAILVQLGTLRGRNWPELHEPKIVKWVRNPGCEWKTISEVPDASGLYAFTAEDGQQMRVRRLWVAGCRVSCRG